MGGESVGRTKPPLVTRQKPAAGRAALGRYEVLANGWPHR